MKRLATRGPVVTWRGGRIQVKSRIKDSLEKKHETFQMRKANVEAGQMDIRKLGGQAGMRGWEKMCTANPRNRG